LSSGTWNCFISSLACLANNTRNSLWIQVSCWGCDTNTHILAIWRWTLVWDTTLEKRNSTGILRPWPTIKVVETAVRSKSSNGRGNRQATIVRQLTIKTSIDEEWTLRHDWEAEEEGNVRRLILHGLIISFTLIYFKSSITRFLMYYYYYDIDLFMYKV